MAVLQVVRGSVPGQVLELHGERTVIGRHPNCQIVLDDVAVSRHHSQILATHGSYFLEDVHSRNGTWLNNEKVERRTRLKDGDEIRICDVVFRFQTRLPGTGDQETAQTAVLPSAGRPPDDASEILPVENIGGSTRDRSSIISRLDANASTNARLSIRPELKLRAVLELSRSLSSVLKIDDVLQRILDGLFTVFPQADAGFILLKEPEAQRLVVRATRFRRSRDTEQARVSSTIVRQAMQTGEAILSADATHDSRFESSASLSNLQIRSVMCVPLAGQDRAPLGVIEIDSRDSGSRFSQDDLDLLISVASQAALAIQNASLHEELLRQRDLERELEFATQVQLGFLPREWPRIDGYEFFDHYEAAHRVGGDYFDYIDLPDGRTAIALGDVAGKGVPAALLMATLYATARYQLLAHPTAVRALSGLNSEIFSSGLGHRFITLLLAVIDPRTHELTIANAGHLPPLIRNAAGDVQAVGMKESGMPLGIVPEQSFGELTVTLKPGDTVVLYTDGITEAMNRHNDIWHRRRLSECVSRGAANVEELVRNIIADVETFCDGQSQRDDMCLVCFQRTR